MLSDPLPYVAGELCSLCDSLFNESSIWQADDTEQILPTDGCKNHYSFLLLQQSAASGCHLCSIFQRWIRKILRTTAEHSIVSKSLPTQIRTFSTRERDHILGTDFRIYVELSHKGQQIRIICEVPRPGEYCNLPWYYTELNSLEENRLKALNGDGITNLQKQKIKLGEPWYPHLTGSTSSDLTIERIKDLLQLCIRNHPECQGRLNTKIPSRLLDLNDLVSNRTIALVDSSVSTEVCSSYMTLSHRWGSHKPLQLISTTEAGFRTGKPLSELPKLFQDACLVTFQLGYRYLWIDALCIRQDDENDWISESAIMGEIYAGSVLNISASAACDSSMTMFSEYNPLSLLPCIIRPKSKYFEKDKLEIGPYISAPLEGQPLYHRSWVFQERLLAPRVVHFTDDQILWECNHGMKSEVAQYSYPSATRTAGKLELKTHFSDIFSFTDSSNPHFRIWTEIVALYSTMALTQGSDKLVALSGIANQMSRGAVGRLGAYHAGLWDYNFALQLAWSVRDPHYQHLSHRSIMYRAPSWSWAAIDGEVEWQLNLAFPERDIKVLLVNILSVETTPVQSYFGHVISSTVRIAGCLCRAEPVLEDVTGLSHPSTSGLDRRLLLTIGNWTYPGECVRWDDDSFDSATRLAKAELYLLPLWQMRRNPRKSGEYNVQYSDAWDYNPRKPGEGFKYSDDTDDLGGMPKYFIRSNAEDDFIALILEFTGAKGQYRRAGLFVERKMKSGAISDVIKCLDEQNMLEDRHFDLDLANNMFTIEII
jgi:hypothetical protein